MIVYLAMIDQDGDHYIIEMQVAKGMLKEGELLDKIKKYTGLSARWLGRIKSELEEEKTTT